jgi:CRP/FNR family transcriptional regulator, cyclic AMP receptor protein
VPELSEADRIQREVFLKTMVPRARHSFWATSRIAEAMEDVRARAGEVVFEAGTPAEHYYFVVEGEVEMVRPGGAPWTVTGPGLVGVIDVALARPHVRKAVAKTDARILRLPAPIWFDALEDSFDLARSVIASMASAVLGLRMRPPPAGGFDPPVATTAPAIVHSVVDRILFLREVPIFRRASTQALTSLAEATEVVTLAAGAQLFAADEGQGRLYVLLSGEIEVVHAMGPVTGRFRAGSLVGGPAALVDHHGGFSARATEPSSVLAIGFDDYFDVMEEHFSLGRSAMTFMATEVDLLLERQADTIAGRDVR